MIRIVNQPGALVGKDGYGFFKCHAVLALILTTLVIIPGKSSLSIITSYCLKHDRASVSRVVSRRGGLESVVAPPVAEALALDLFAGIVRSRRAC